MALNSASSLVPFFAPQGVAVIGASTDPTKLGYGIAQNLVKGGYPGAIHFVNPKGGRLFGRPVFTAVTDVPDPLDLAVILVPPHVAPPTLEACGARGVRAAIVAAGGFSETGSAGAALEEECLAIAQRYGMRLLGPNCIGVIDTHLPLDTTFLPPPSPPEGEIAFVSHSGAICAAIVDWSRGQGFGFSRLVSLGNQADVTETEVLAAVAEDEHTAVITLYLESLSSGRAFATTAREVAREKPVLVLKAGRSEAGKQAAASHTGALAGTDAAFDAACRWAGLERATTAEELFAWARALAWCPLPQGKRVAVLTNAGGPGVLAVDALERHDLSLAVLSQETVKQLCEVLPEAASTVNPVDMLAAATPEQYAACLGILLAEEAVEAVLVIVPPPPMSTAGGVARALIPLIQTAQKPVVLAVMGHGLVQEALAFLRAVHIPTYEFPETAVSALAVLARRAARRERAEQAAPTPPGGVDREAARHLLAVAGPGWLGQETLRELLAAYGIRTPPAEVAWTSAAAVAAAERIGYPVVLKIAAAEVLHKSDVGGVALNLEDGTAVVEAFIALTARARAARPEATIEGVLVQGMAARGQELALGLVQDAQFGPLLLAGSGGVEMEGLRDVAFALGPLNAAEARDLLRRTWAGRRLGGYRSIAAGDETAVVDTLQRLGWLAADFPELAELEINPLIAHEVGVTAVDVRGRLELNGRS